MSPAMPPGHRYVRHLGAGGFGDVHLAEHVGTGRLVAVKHIQRHALADPDTVARFRREARILAATEVASVVRVYDLDTTSDPAFLIMEYVPGVTLWDLMEAAPLPAAQGLAVLWDVAEALQVMGERGLVHRDIKPSNVFVLPDGSAKLGDFGLARAVADDAGFRTAGAPAGTPAYFPPEVSSGTAEATAESDAYSFAVMVYEVLTGVLPITAPDAVSLITAHWTQAPRPVTDAMPGFPQAPASVLMRALAKEPAGRPLPHELMRALATVPADQWPTSQLPLVPVPEALQLDARFETPSGALGEGAAPVLRGQPTVLCESGSTAPPTVPTPAEPSDADAAVRGHPAPPSVRRAPRPAVRRRSRFLVPIALLPVVVAAAGAVALRRDNDRDPPGTGQLRVQTASLVAEPARAECPRSQVTLELTVRTNGMGGEFTVSWVLPDGSSGPRQSFAVADGQTAVRATLEITLTGRRPITAEAAAVVSPPGLRAAAPVAYTCGQPG